MLENFKYVNHLGESFGNGDGVRIKLSGMRDYEWNYEEDNNTIKRFRRKLHKKSIPITLLVDPNGQGLWLWDSFDFDNDYDTGYIEPEDPLEVRNRIFEIAEKDVLAKEPGRIYLNDYYLSGYIIASEKSGHMNTYNLMQNDVSFLALDRGWIKEKTQRYERNEPEEAVIPEEEEPEITMADGIMYGEYPYEYYHYVAPVPGEGDFPAGVMYPEYPYDYHKGRIYSYITNDSFTSSHFTLRIYGPVSEPIVMINGHTYGVHATIEDNEYIEIDSYNKSVKLVSFNGLEYNIFNQRMKGQSVFEKIPSGTLNVNWDEKFTFEITLYDERSEPAWS